MGRQKGLYKMRGTLGGVTHYQTKDGDLVREKGGSSCWPMLFFEAMAAATVCAVCQSPIGTSDVVAQGFNPE